MDASGFYDVDQIDRDFFRWPAGVRAALASRAHVLLLPLLLAKSSPPWLFDHVSVWLCWLGSEKVVRGGTSPAEHCKDPQNNITGYQEQRQNSSCLLHVIAFHWRELTDQPRRP